MSDNMDELESAVPSKPEKAVVVDPLIMSTIGLVGDITEESSNEVIFSLLLLHEKQSSDYLKTIFSLEKEELDKLTDEDLADMKPNIDFYISTNGGSADEMFGIYDVMRFIKDGGVSSITTCGIGKVMSAGVLLLAAGTKGKRRVGKHCRIMLHSVIGGSTGPMHQLENEFAEVKKIQDAYIKTLVEETNMTEKELRKLLKRKTNVYLSAEEAVKMGIADEVF
jgi:ATP-dependent Clp endopeptidase proteolytic subunit ClpP